ncbi:MAG: zinc carboxypeptidase [Flavobacteriaceae bacterium]|nr:MAG: zinc carboxypeptidase [Flavobacteriaceae bacterium]
MKHLVRSLIFLFTIIGISQEIKSPSEFLGYELGTQFTRHHEVVDYYEYLAKTSADRVQLVEYGKTNERRPLLLAYVSSASNMQNLESIREEHLKSTTGESNASKAIVWLSYNVHGNESVSTEASMKTIYELLTNKSSYLENTIVIIDPCINPDGRDRYVNWYNQYKNTPNNVDPNSKEHVEGWLNGRSNHYMFDLNRDWAWLTQVESEQRLKVYNKWLPHVHVDFHEQGVNSPYYFAPAAEPFHEVITDFQRDFQVTIGKNHAKYFDANGWLYFTKEVFDLFYPSYGDTYPTYNGAIGMTYEQGGSGRAGLGIITRIGDTLTLKDRIAHHFTTGISTVEVSANNAAKLNTEFKKFYQNKAYKYKSYVLNGNKGAISTLENLLNKHEIDYGRASNGTAKGFHYKTGKTGSIRTSDKTLVVSTNQPKGTLVKVLFEPHAKLTDSLTYDITAWSLPYAYGLDAIASENLVNKDASWQDNTEYGIVKPKAYAHVSTWNSMKDARFLAALLQEKIRVRYAAAPFAIKGSQFNRGSLIIINGDNQNKHDFQKKLNVIAKKHRKELVATTTGFVDSGKDFGSSSVQMVPEAKIAVLSGGPTSTLRFGEIWHFFEQQLHYPLAVLNADYIKRIDLSKYNILILPEGRGYERFFDAKTMKNVKEWVNNGGKLIAMGSAISGISGEKGFAIKEKKIEKDSTGSFVQTYEKIQREQVKDAITGAIFKTKVDNTHPLAFGYGNNYHTLKLGNSAYNYLDKGTVVYLENSTVPVTGFAGSEAQKKVENTLIFGVENHGQGQVIYMVDNPLFRGFWENGKLFFANALFMVN